MSETLFKCGVEAVIDLVGGKWKILILFYLMKEERLRFGELRRLIGEVSEKMLSQQLKELARDGLVRRIDYDTVPPHVAYELQDFGRELGFSLRPICEWGTANLEKISEIAAVRRTG